MLKPAEVFNIEKNQISTKYQCSILINFKDYDQRTFIETSTKFQIPGILDFFFPELNDYCQIVLNYPVDVHKTNNMTIEKTNTTIYYDSGDIVITKDYVSTTTDIGLLVRLLGGHVKYVRDPRIIVNMLHDILPGVDLVHLELIVSNMFRILGNEDERCRLKGNYKNSTILGVKQQPFQDSWKSALAFQYIEKAIQQGLVKGKAIEENPIEKVLNEDFAGLLRGK